MNLRTENVRFERGFPVGHSAEDTYDHAGLNRAIQATDQNKAALRSLFELKDLGGKSVDLHVAPKGEMQMNQPKNSQSRRVVRLSAATALVVLATHPLHAQDAGAVDPAAIEAFERMSAYVGSLPSFRLDVTYSFDLISGEEQTITIDGTAKYRVRRPDRFLAEVSNDLFARNYIYDGTKLTVLAPEENYFAQADAAPTIREMLAASAARLGTVLPLADLFDLGTEDSPIHRVSHGYYVGEGEIDGAKTTHWAFRSEHRDWELWITIGDKPLPVKLTVTDTSQPEHPRYVATVRWTPEEKIADADFTFVPKPEHKQIEFLLTQAGGQ